MLRRLINCRIINLLLSVQCIAALHRIYNHLPCPASGHSGVRCLIPENVVKGGDNVFTFCVCALSRSQFLTDFDEIWHRRLEPKKKDPFRWGENPIRVSPFFTPFYPELAPT